MPQHKAFDRIELEPNDDGTFSIEYTPHIPPTKNKEGEPVHDHSFEHRKTLTAESLDEALRKIKKLATTPRPKNGFTDLEDFLAGGSEGGSAHEDE